MDRLDFLLINPGGRNQIYKELGSLFSSIEPPFWTGLLAAFIREKGFSVKIIDADAEGWGPEYTAEKSIEYNPVLAGIGVIGPNPSASSTPKMPSAGRISAILKDKAPHIKSVLYGIHPSALPEKTLKESKADFICCGEAFYTLLELLRVLKSDSKTKEYDIKGLCYMKDSVFISNGTGELVSNLDELPFIPWDLMPVSRYRAHNWHCLDSIDQRQPYAVLYTSLGCPYSCDYCNIHMLYSGRPGIRFRSPGRVIEELDFILKNHKLKNIKIMDEIFVLKEPHAAKICDLIIQRGYELNMWAYARVDTVNERILKKMKQAGINWLCYGIESGSKGIREGVIKGGFEQEEIVRAVRMTHDAGIHVIANFMFGLPEDNLETMEETLNMARKLNCEYVNFYTTMAYPGSCLYKEALSKGARLSDDWLEYAQLSDKTRPLPTRYLSSAEVLDFRDKALEEYYRSPAYLDMIRDKFGLPAVEHISQMIEYKIQRKLLA